MDRNFGKHILPVSAEDVATLKAILADLDAWGRPKQKMPDCPACGNDELGVIGGRVLCYSCGLEVYK